MKVFTLLFRVFNLQGDFKKIDIPRVDLLIMSQVFHHVEQPGEFLESLRNKLNPGKFDFCELKITGRARLI